MGEYGFRQFQDLLAALQRDVEALKRKAAGGVVTDIELMCYPSNAAPPLLFGGPNGGLVGNMYRHGQHADIQARASVVSTNSAVGALAFKLPFVVHTYATDLVPAGMWRLYDSSAGNQYFGPLYTYKGLDYILGSYGNAAANQGLAMTIPVTLAANDDLWLDFRVRIAPGY